MRIAIVSDIHGNLLALEAVIADLDTIRPDMVLHGGDPVPVAAGPRVGITRNAEPHLRFAWSGEPAVSAPRLRHSENA